MRKKLFDEQEAKQFAFISGIKNKFHVMMKVMRMGECLIKYLPELNQSFGVFHLSVFPL